MSWIFFCELGIPDSPEYLPSFILVIPLTPVSVAGVECVAPITAGVTEYPNPGSVIVTPVIAPPKSPTARVALLPK